MQSKIVRRVNWVTIAMLMIHMSFTSMPKEIYHLLIHVKVPMVSFPRSSHHVLLQGHITFLEKNFITKCPAYFHLLWKWRHSNLGDYQLHYFMQTQRLGEDTVVRQFLLALCVSCALANNQIAHYTNGPI